jgi:hypothetical protein
VIEVRLPRSGYLDPAYAAAMSMDGRALALPRSGGAIVVRRIPGTDLMDAMAPHPFLVCLDWRRLGEDIADLKDQLVSLTAVTDPLSEVVQIDLRQGFPDLVRPYKEHYIIDLARPPESFVDPHHRGCARHALRKVSVERCEKPSDHLDEWLELYSHLVRRHSIRGPARLIEHSCRLQLQLPGLSMFRARRHGETIGAILCMAHGENAYFHLGAYNETGYRSMASYALVWTVIHHFAAAGCKTLSIGAGAGAAVDPTSGLTAFKRGWASGTKMTYLCGAILDLKAYRMLSAQTTITDDMYFPPYRSGEFA